MTGKCWQIMQGSAPFQQRMPLRWQCEPEIFFLLFLAEIWHPEELLHASTHQLQDLRSRPTCLYHLIQPFNRWKSLKLLENAGNEPGTPFRAAAKSNHSPQV